MKEPAVGTVVDIVRHHRHQDAPAISLEGRTVSFRELDEQSSRAAQALSAAGVTAGDRVAFLDKNRPEYFDIVFGAAKLGAVCVAVNWRLSAREITHVVTDAGARVLFVGAGLAGLVETIEAELMGETIVVALDAHPRWPMFGAWTTAHPPVDPGVEPAADTVVLQLYTSGTTGLPKGVMLTNRNLFAMVRAAGPTWGFRAGMTSLGVSPLFHIAGSGWNLMVLAYGGHVVLHRDVDAEAILRDIPRHGVTHGILVPAILQMILARRETDGADASSLETVVYGASPISDDMLLALFDAFDCDFVQGYGLTETSGAVTILPAEDHDRSRPELLRSCGHALPGVELRIVDPDTGVRCADGDVGEVLIRSEQVMAGYWHQPDATAEAISSDGWFRSGDAGYLRDGRLYLHDRIKDMIVSGAENVYPAEVENVLMRHPAIVDVAVIGVPDERWGETVKAVVVLAEGTSLTADEVITHARADLARYKCPTSVDFVTELPRNPSGKVLKRELREPYWAGRDRRVG